MPILGANSSGGSRPSAPVIGSATDGGTGTTASVAFTPSTYIGKGTITYTATSSPGNFTATSASSPITVSGLTAGTAYTFTVTGTTNYGVTSTVSSASNSVTPATPSSFESIASYTFTAPTYGSSFTFSSIPQTYKHLQFRIFSSNTDANVTTMMYMTVSGNTTVRSHWLTGDGSVNAGTNSTYAYLGKIPANNSSSATIPRAATIVDIIDYASTTKIKTYRSFNGYDSNAVVRGQEIGLYSGAFFSNTNAFTSITIWQGNDWTPGSTIALYGIKG
jgi:hypothetical protein